MTEVGSIWAPIGVLMIAFLVQWFVLYIMLKHHKVSLGRAIKE